MNQRNELTISDLKKEIVRLSQGAGQWNPQRISIHACPAALEEDGIRNLELEISYNLVETSGKFELEISYNIVEKSRTLTLTTLKR